jgi:two-component system, cell cycle sensor histidine kinase and response regulator CckA
MICRAFLRIVPLALVLLFFFPAHSLTAQSQQTDDIKRVLVLYPENNGISKWMDLFDNALKSALRKRIGKDVEMNIEYTDLSRNSLKIYTDQLADLFKLKYGNIPPDVIIAHLSPDSEFVLNLCNNVFPNAKVIFFFPDSTPEGIINRYHGKATGLLFEKPYEGSIKTIIKLLPNTKNIYFISGNLPFEQNDVKKAKEIFPKHSDKVNVTYLVGLSPDEILKKLSNPPEDSVIFFTTYIGAPDGKWILSHDLLSLVSKNAKMPIFSYFDQNFEKDILGGEMISSENLGEKAGELTIKLLEGEDPASIKPEMAPTISMFNWRQLQKWGIDEKLLPENSIIKYRESSFFEKYRWRILLWISLVLLQSALIAYLVTSLARRRQAEKALSDSERKYRRLIESTRDAIISIDRDGIIKTCNMGAAEMFGYPEGEIIGHSLMILFPKDARERLASNIKGVAAEDGFLEYESAMTKKDEREIPVKVGMSALKNESDEIIGLILIIRDISEQKIAEEERRSLEAALRQSQKMEAIGTLAGGIAHDFNNILTAVIGFTELALFKVKKGAKEEANLHEVLKAGRRAKDLVNQILTFARKTREEVKPILIGPIADDVLKLLRSTVPSCIEFKRCMETESLVMADKTRIHQIFLNICTNAVQAMEADRGVLTVDIRDVAVDSDSGLQPGDYVRICISDTGIGIPKEHLDLIFDPYFTTKSAGEGTGLGLSVVHGIVDIYGGKIIAESEMNHGTSFTIYLPATKLNAAIEQRKQEDLPRGSECILFVDDEPAIVEMARQLLNSLGYKATCKNGSMDALEMFRKNPWDFDLIITDMTMPDMNGDRLSAELIKIRNDIPVILCTGYSKTMSEETALRLGIKAFLMKPMEYAELAQTIRRVLDNDKKIQ